MRCLGRSAWLKNAVIGARTNTSARIVPPGAVRLIVFARLVVNVRRELVIAEHEREVREPTSLALLREVRVAGVTKVSLDRRH